ncbi:MAG: ABC transporter substrate-binding protein [Acidobacteria bacterium]|nr:MAG: ABC transporter substrate-binding protein [Acidobacteriota bacterium]
MFLYNIRIGIKSLRRNPILTALLIAAIALGICVSTTFIALRHIYEADPLPGKSDKLFYVRLDNWDPARAYNADDPKSLPNMITYRDMRALMQSNIPTRQSGMYVAGMFAHPDPKIGRPFGVRIRMCFNDFFTMFNIPFQYGSGWDKAADAKPEQVIVINQDQNQKMFGGGNSVGRTIRLDDRDYKVVGVIGAEWKPAFRFYDYNGGTVPPEGVFMPFNLTPVLQLNTAANSDGWKNQADNTYESFLQSEQTWIEYWAELPTPEKQQAFRDYVTNYVVDQKKHGRFERPLHIEITSMPQTMSAFQIVPPTVKSMSIVSLLFLIVCSLNLVGLLLGKFLARVPEVSVRRALGASKFQVFWQHVVECELVGIIGGAIGLVLSIGTLQLIAKMTPQNTITIGLDGEMVFVSIFLSLVAGLLAGLYPSWRVCTIAPAMQLKVQ